MIIRIDGKVAELPADLSFEYYEENQLFSDVEGYTLEIELPLAGSAANREIFGLIDIKPPSEGRQWPMQLECGAVNRSGVAALTDVGGGKVKIQFIAGKTKVASGEDLQTDIRTALGEWDKNSGSAVMVDPNDQQMGWKLQLPAPSVAMKSYDDQLRENNGNIYNWECVALPWINDTNESAQNQCYGNTWSATTQKTGLSWMPYLISLAKRIAMRCGYSTEFSAWEASDKRNLVVCNAVPTQGPMQTHYVFRDALPAWTAEEFFTSLEPLLGCLFEFDHVNDVIKFRDLEAEWNALPQVELKDVEDDPDVSSTFGMEETELKFKRNRNYKYASPGTDMWPILDCPWYVDRIEKITTSNVQMSVYETVTALLNDLDAPNGRYTHAQQLKIYYAKDVDIWFCVDAGGTHLVPCNCFGPSQYNADGDVPNETELKAVPCTTDAVGLHLAPRNAKDYIASITTKADPENPDVGGDEPVVDTSDTSDGGIYDWSNGTAAANIMHGEEEEKAEAKYDTLQIGYWEGYKTVPGRPTRLTPSVVGVDWYGKEWWRTPVSLRLNGKSDRPFGFLPEIDESITYTFRFFSDGVPDIRSVFYINSRRYLCRKLKVTLTADGMKRRMEGEFNPLA